MTTYSSDKAVPYVYICTHKDTNQFYIGYRMANVELNIPSHLDLPEYKTSSTTVRPDWSNYTWTIVAEFFDPSDAYTFEQHLIFDNWKNPLLLNGHYNLGENQFRVSGPSPLKGKPSGRKGKPSPLKGKPSGRKGKPSGKQQNPSKNPSPLKGKPSPLKGKPNGKKGISTGSQGPRGKQQNPSKNPSPKKGKPSPLKGKPSPKKDKPSGKQQNPAGKQRIVECPHCGKKGGINAMTRRHFDNCKKKSDPNIFSTEIVLQ